MMDDSVVPSSKCSTVHDFARKRRSLRNQKSPESSSGVSTDPRENGIGAQDIQDGRNEKGIAPSRSKRPGKNVQKSESEIIEEAMKPLTDDERKAWKGWCELESDPALFNFVLREYGVKDVKIQEVLGLEDEMLQFLPKPVYGLVFLFKYMDDDEEDEEVQPKCPNHVWFANQTTHNACATIALLNIVMNVPDLDLGGSISSFKEATQLLKPAYRGQKLGENEHIRSLHNSFARRMDVLNADLALSNEVSAWKKRRKTKRRGGKSMSSSDEDSSFHFIAFVPIDGVVWRLDGLRRQPVSLGYSNDDWISVARANIYQHIERYGNDLQFNLLSLCRSPLRSIPLELAQNIQAIRAIEAMLSQGSPDWNNFNQADNSEPIRGPSEAFGVTDSMFRDAVLSASACNIPEREGTDASALLRLHQQWVAEQRALCVAYRDELSSINNENEQAARRTKDHTPLVYRTLRNLAERGLLNEIIGEIQET